MKPVKYLYPILILFVLLSGCTQKEALSVRQLSCEYLENPLGIDTPIPRLSWKIKTAERGQKQTGYQIMASSSDDDNGDFWNSGKIESEQSIQVKYNGKPVDSRQRIVWKVRVWDKDGQVSPWSEAAYFEMALLKDLDWSAQWIGADTVISVIEKPAPLFKKIITFPQKTKNARVYISGLGYYELTINGKKIGDHVLTPNQTNYDRRQGKEGMDSRVDNMSTRVLYETYDITDALQSGENVITVLLGNGWYYSIHNKSFKRLWYDTPRFIAQFEVELNDGTKMTINSDESWKYKDSPLIHNDVYSGEIYDACLEEVEASWKNAKLVRRPTGKLHAQMSPPDRVIRRIKPISCKKIDKGVYRYDLGEMISGWVRLTINGKRGDRVKMKFIEEMGPSYWQSDTYILKGGGVETYEPRFTWHAFRYVDVYGSSVPLTVENILGKVVNTDVESAGYFECSNELFNKIHENFRRTQLGNMHGGIPSDCPHRERRGYTGDGQIAAPSAIFNFDMAAFYTKWLNDIFDTQNGKTGYIANTDPYQDGGGGLAWEAAGVIIPWYLYIHYGDTNILERYYKNMKKWVSYTESHIGDDGIVMEQQLGVWVAPEATATPPNLVSTAYYYHTLNLLKKIAKVLNNESDLVYFNKLAQRTKEAFHKKYYLADKKQYSIGRQGSNVFPLGFKLVPEQVKDDVLFNLIHHIKEETNSHFDTGMMATSLLLEVLNDSGHEDLAYTLMNQRDFPSFGFISKDATTLWETWQGDASHSHPMFGSVCQWFYHDLAGINPDPEYPGYKRIIIKPHPISGLDWVKAAYESTFGKIKTDWKVENSNFILNVSIPANSSAIVYLPAVPGNTILENGHPLSDSENIKLLSRNNSRTQIKIGSGDYSFISKNIEKLIKKPDLLAPDIIPLDSLILIPDKALVHIKSYSKDAEIRYTLDGSEPQKSSTLYKAPFEVANRILIKAKVFKSGYAASVTKSSSLVFIDPHKQGLQFSYYEGAWKKLPDFKKLKVVKSGKVYKIGLDAAAGRSDQFGLVFEGFINIPIAGIYKFYVNSNDGSCLFIDKKVIVLNDGEHGPLEKKGTVNLSKGKHRIKLSYFQAGGGQFLEALISGPGMNKKQIPADMLFVE